MSTSATAPKQSAPSEKMIAAGKSAAERHGVSLPKNFATDYSVAKEFLDKYLAKPSPKALSFAERIAKDAGVELPADVAADSKKLSAWIDEHKAK